MDDQNIRDAGLKVTTPRVKILEILESSDLRHMSAEDVYKALLEREEEIGLATIYRVLTQFEGAGLVQRHNFEGGQAVFELDHGGHHDHIVCMDCGHVEEFVDEGIEQAQHRVAEEKGFELSDHSLILYARCTKKECIHRS
ncbi:ferric iron uptake transcriptional regulator [Solemya velum gill symbiont]|uniref:Ferric uptake regulation protein n=1 Tax=Solemya velum gill symbiont TaxID=2340 RepID=A0A0B0HBA3_SOVGS|nr:ferric iron uptake transcriptional regulator [Solemya velum gill symbiont]KHF25164.1 ferric uptake regulator [Solemya velum gill symbiont]OOY34884.1 transcriptional repressor [Solemya velum gill symbiont]OOY37599.1 transcriptional repressor [Solemya velum gill symbiont]OOY40642.1 transcriptional repressor [Solemya velum gill symbiont]OOY41900.1 transcriptional repressor [Solemya velum gill symbiont]